MNQSIQKKFNITGVCNPEKHYIVDTKNKLNQIMQMVNDGDYFIISKPRQYGKTTILYLLSELLNYGDDYIGLVISFEGIGDSFFLDEKLFSNGFAEMIQDEMEMLNQSTKMLLNMKTESLKDVSKFITTVCKNSSKNIVLMIDEVDKSSDSQLFISFLGMIRDKYLKRDYSRDFTFHNVILAGVHDVRNLKIKLRPEAEKKYNSPWNIAAEFKTEMSFSPYEIGTMLKDYKENKNIEININEISERLYYYTSGYPFLVSKLCKIIDEVIMKNQQWSLKDVDIAAEQLIWEKNTNFESLINNLENNPDLYNIIYDLLIEGARKVYNELNPIIGTGTIYGIFKNKNKILQIHNRIYEQVIYNYLSSKMETSITPYDYNFRDDFILSDNTLNIEKILLKFQEFMKCEYSKKDVSFLEKHGRLIFLAFLKPIINGNGFDFKEVQISEERRLDVVITWMNKQYIVELKIWRGSEAHKKGIIQLSGYLDTLNLKKGYLIIFDFRKLENKQWKNENITQNEKNIFAVWV